MAELTQDSVVEKTYTWTMDGEHLKIIKLLNLCIINAKRCTLMSYNI